MKQICGFCLKEFKGKYCDCNDEDKRTFFSHEIDFKMINKDKVMCDCGTTKFNFAGVKDRGNIVVINFKCDNCGKTLGTETYLPNEKPIPINPRGGEYINLLEDAGGQDEG